MRKAPLALCLVPLFLAGCAGSSGIAGPGAADGPVTVGIVAINDFHGALEPPKQSVRLPDGKGGIATLPAGGAAFLASAIDRIRARYRYTLTVTAGDLISASQFASSVYLDEPAIGVANRIGVEYSAVGNHEFDQGRRELLRKQSGGCVQYTLRKPCAIEPFAGAKFRFLAASTLTEDGSPLFPGTALKTFGSGGRKVTVGLIGLTLKGTTELVSPEGIKGLTFADEADTINRLVPQLKAQGADAVVVLIHQGGKQDEKDAPADPNGCAGFTGDIRPILDRLNPGVDLVVSGHTHKAYVCDYGKLNPARPVLLTSAGVYGEEVTDIALRIDPGAHKVVGLNARNIVVQSTGYDASTSRIEPDPAFPQFTPRADIAAYVKMYTDAAAVFSRRPVGRISGQAGRAEETAVGSTGGALGNLIADAQLAATVKAGAQIAFMNPFGIRAALNPARGGMLTYGEIYAVQPFNNTLSTFTLTGAELKETIEQGLDDKGPNQLLSPSAGFAYRFDMRRPVGDRVVSLTLDGKPIDAAAAYRVTVSNFLALGGDGFAGFLKGRNLVIGGTDIDALESWIAGVPVRAVPAESRVSEIK